MTTQVRVSIATTAGPIAVERIAPIGLRKSRVYTWAAREPLPTMSASYDEFVRKRIARIPALDRGSTFRIDLSGEIDTGESWQLPVFTAHALQSAQRLAGKDEEDAAATFLFATGTIDFEMAAGEVGYVEDKLRLLVQDSRLRRAAESGRRVIVAVPEANSADGRAEQEQLRALGAEVLQVRQIEDLLRRLALNIRPRGADPDDAWEGSPFRGLEVFDVRHRKIFWGRGKAREEALQVLRQQDLYGCAFLLIHGSSGVGKSSLARAGLLGDLEQMASANDRWRSAIVVPSRGKRSPLPALAEALAEAVPELQVQPAELATRIPHSPSDVADAIAAALAKAETGGRVRVALLVDQLEELLLWAREEQTGQAAGEREAFAETLSRLARTRLVWVIATLRSDLMSLLEDSPMLSDLARNDRLYRLERPRPGALSEIIRRPAELAGVRFVGHDKDNLPLVDVLTDAARGQQDCLPLLQFTLKLLYDDKQAPTGTISYAQYQGAGGLENAIGIWADKTVAALGDGPEIERAVDDVIFNLARRGRETDVVVGAEFFLDDSFVTPVRDQVINALDKARLIVFDADPKTRRRTVRVAHEALLTHWWRARALFEIHGAKLALKEDVERSAIRWREQKRHGTFLILGEAPLVEAEQLLNDGRVALSDLAREYIKDSLAAHRELVDSVKARFARDEQKIADLIRAGAYGEADVELERVVLYLSDQADAELRGRRDTIAPQRARIRRLAEYDGFAKTVFPKAGQEDFEPARVACQSALQAFDVLEDSEWQDNLPVQDLSSEQIADVRQDIYRLLLLYSGLQIVPGIRSLFNGRQAAPSRRVPMWALKLLIKAVPESLLARVLRRGGIGRFRLPTRQDNAPARLAFDSCLAALREARRMEQATQDGGSQRSRTSMLVERLVGALSELAVGPKGQPIDYSRFLASTAPTEFAEPVNAADYFFMGLFNYFIAKRSRDGAVAAFLSFLQGNFPELDARSPLVTAERLLRTAIALEPRNFWPHWVLGRTLLETRDYAAAELAFNAAVALEPRYARGYEQRAVALAKQWGTTRDDRLRERAKTDSRLAGQFAAGDPSIFWPRGELFDVLGETKEALNAYSLWLELEEDIMGTVARSDGLARLHRRANAMLADARAQPLHADAHALLALVNWTWKDYGAALKAADAAIQIAPNHRHALGVKGAVLREMGKPHEAIDNGLAPALAADPQDFWVLLNKAKALDELSEADAAQSAWQDLVARAATQTQDLCPPWILGVAEARIDRLRRDLPVQSQGA
ncbi:MAG TPA: hypothetical protein VMU81_15045 [Acetobacteraceae bacterium]|nr:hypothetical protein [Acetobacteraceae bacterium]